ncbi:hypothetical protein [Promicromonospora sp. NPDC050262]|uniref:hypothetical protein n=1 Tax=Promicromonospora sp. NPDC050262 TaxID=3155036 RepID=UPI0033D5F659
MITDQDEADARFLRVLLFIGIGIAVVVGLVLGVSYYQEQRASDERVCEMFNARLGTEGDC